VLDVSLEKNHDALVAALDAGAQVRYIDHHFPGDIPVSDALQTHIDTDAETCTGLIVDGLLDGKYRAWAVTAAFGDNLQVKARAAAEPLGLDAADVDRLERLGTLLNYNGYGASVKDLHFAPDDLSLRLRPFESPFDFCAVRSRPAVDAKRRQASTACPHQTLIDSTKRCSSATAEYAWHRRTFKRAASAHECAPSLIAPVPARHIRLRASTPAFPHSGYQQPSITDA